MALSIKYVFSRNSTLVFCFLLCMLVAGLFAGVGLSNLLSLLLVFIFGILIPGFIILYKVRLQLKNTISLLFVSFGIGYALLAILYAVLIYFNIHKISPYILYTISAIALLALLNRKIRLHFYSVLKDNNDDNIFLLIISVVLVLFGFLVFQFPLRSVLDSGYLDMHMDHTYWFKNCVASTKGYPLPELSVFGVDLYWHLFSCFDIALFHFATGIEIYNLCFSLSYVWHVFLMVGGAYALTSELLKNKKYVFTALVLILMCSSAEPYTLVYYLDHLWGCSMGTSDAIAESMFALLLTLKVIEKQYINWRFVPIAIIMIIATVGYKSPVGFVLLVGVGCALFILCCKNRSAIIPSLVLMVILFILTVILCKVFVIADNALTSSTSNHKLVLNFMTIFWPDINSYITGVLEGWGIRPMITALLLVIPYVLVMHPIMLVLAFVLVGLFGKRKAILNLSYKYQVVGFPFIVMAIVGIVAFLSLNHPGLAQCYFLFAGIPFAVLFCFLAIEAFYNEKYCKYRPYLYALICCSFLATIACARETYTLDGKYCPNPTQLSYEGTSLTRNELVGLRWARNNLPESAILLTNKGLAPIKGNRSFVTSAYSERQVYLEGSSSTIFPNDHFLADRIDIIIRYFNGDYTAREELKREGVTHVIIYKSLPDVTFEGSKLLYENEEMTIRTI